MNIKHILVPVDFSESTQSVVRDALELAGKFSARITLYHVLQPVFPPVGELDVTFDKRDRAMQDEAEKRLRELAGSTASKTKVNTAMEPGIPWDRIVNRASKYNVDLIVMGTHGRSGLKHLWLGSVAERVVQHAPCSVMVVRERPKGDEDVEIFL
jgi:universal stress protein A